MSPFTLPPGAIPAAEPAAVELLRGVLPGVDVAIPSSGVVRSRTPFVRVTPTGREREAPARWERTPIFQVDVYADTVGDAADAAALIAYEWPLLGRVELRAGGYVTGCWVETQPRLFPSPAESDPPRYLLELGLRLHARRTL